MQDPAFDPCYFEDDVGQCNCLPLCVLYRFADLDLDLQVLIEGMHFVRKLAAMSPLNEILGELEPPLLLLIVRDL